jgi:hypothetical protein
LAALSGRERLLLAVAAVLLPAVGGLLRLMGYRRVRAALAWLVRAPRIPAPDAEARIGATVRMVDLATTRLPLRPACLPRSLVLWTLLRAQGVAAELRLGVRAGGVPLDAHAWVEFAGRPLNETPEVVRSYAVLEERRAAR